MSHYYPRLRYLLEPGVMQHDPLVIQVFPMVPFGDYQESERAGKSLSVLDLIGAKAEEELDSGKT